MNLKCPICKKHNMHTKKAQCNNCKSIIEIEGDIHLSLFDLLEERDIKMLSIIIISGGKDVNIGRLDGVSRITAGTRKRKFADRIYELAKESENSEISQQFLSIWEKKIDHENNKPKKSTKPEKRNS